MSTSNLATSLSRSLRERAKNDTLSPAVVTSENERLRRYGRGGGERRRAHASRRAYAPVLLLHLVLAVVDAQLVHVLGEVAAVLARAALAQVVHVEHLLDLDAVVVVFRLGGVVLVLLLLFLPLSPPAPEHAPEHALFLGHVLDREDGPGAHELDLAELSAAQALLEVVPLGQALVEARGQDDVGHPLGALDLHPVVGHARFLRPQREHADHDLELLHVVPREGARLLVVVVVGVVVCP